jgi:hypothetical protein
MPGDHAHVTEGGAIVAVDEHSYDEALKAAVARDEIGKGTLISSGRVFQVEAGSKVLIVDVGWWKYQVRILSTSSEHPGELV